MADKKLLQLKIKQIRHEASAIHSYELVSEDGEALPPFDAGSHIDLHLPSGAIRQYSLSNDPVEKNRYVVGVLRDEHGRGGSKEVHKALRVGDSVSVSNPRNHFQLDESAKKVILLAGGIGITPILSMAHALRSNHQSFEFHYGTRSPELMAFKDVVQEFSHTTLYFDGGDPQRGLQLQTLLAKPISRHHVYVCGPRGLIDAVIATSKRNGWPDDQVHFELFNAYSGQSGDVEFEVELRASGKTLRVPADQSILDIILASGCELMHECKRGECGMCAVRVLEGVPDPRDYNLPEDERASGKVMCVCVSRAKTPRLVLDV